MRLVCRSVLAAAALSCLLPAAGAQEITATITGTVSDETGAVLPGVSVSVRNVGTGFTREAVTNNVGLYTAPLLPTGRYEVTFGLSGFQTQTAQNISLHVNDRIQVDMVLKAGAITETVEVTAAAQMIQPTAAVQTLMAPTQVQELPLNNRNFVQLATLVPGVTSSLTDEVGIGLASNVSISINGQRRNAVNWLVDGAANVDVGSNITLLNTPTLESIEEFKIITSSYAAEWPRSGGGIINVVTKSGTNDWRFVGYEFFRNDALNANSFFRKQSGCQADGTCLDRSADGATNFKERRENPAKLRYNNFGFTAGGPIKKDKLFLFYSQEWRKIERAPTDLSANVPDPAWLTDPGNANYVPPAQRDPEALKLLALFPAPNLGTTRFLNSLPNTQDTRQEVARLDWLVSPNWRVMARYTHDLSQTTEPGGLFQNTAIPNVATTLTDVPGQVFVGQVTTTINPNMFNEASLQFSANAISSVYGDNVRNTRSELGLNIAEIYPENREDLLPTVAISGLAPSGQLGANQLFDNKYRNFTIADNLTWQRGDHQFKGGLLIAMEQKDELSTSTTQGVFNFAAGGGFTAFQNFLRGNRDGACGASCTYDEPQLEIASQFRWQRYEFYVQDSWRVNQKLRLDLGLRYSLQPGFTDKNDLLTNFVPARFDRAQAPQFNADASRLVAGTGDPLNGIVQAGVNSPYGRAVNNTDKNNFQPRLGFSYDVTGAGTTIVRGGYGIYYDQPLMGVFLQNAFVNPPVNQNPRVLNPQLANPGAGSAIGTLPISALIATSDPFDIPRTQQWNVGVQRQLYSRGMVELTYAGSKGDSLIQPVDINQPQPADVVANGGNVNRSRPFPGFAGINLRQTTAHNMYHALLVSFRHDAGRAGLLNISYSLSRARTSATNDRDALDLPQNPLDLEAEYAVARTDRTHVFTANYVYELPFFRNSKGLLKGVLGGWQLSGITSLWSGPPISRVVNGTTNGNRRGIRVNQVSDPFANLPANVPGGVYWFNPAAFAPPADGQYGNTGRAIFRLPGVNQWDLTLSKNFYPSGKTRLQFRADFINAFNHTQLDPAAIQNVCTVAVAATSCAASTGSLGQITGTRAPREIQLGLKFFWN
jgi:carboxypeptidase family protein